MSPRTFIVKLKRSLVQLAHLISSQVGKLKTSEEDGLATGQAWWRGRSTKLGVRRLGLESQLCHQVLGTFGQVLSSLWVQSAVVSGWGSGSQGYLAG